MIVRVWTCQSLNLRMDFTTGDENSWVLCRRLHSDHGRPKPETQQTLSSKWKEKQTPAESTEEARKKTKTEERRGYKLRRKRDDISIKYYRSNKMRMKKHMSSTSNSEVAGDLEKETWEIVRRGNQKKRQIQAQWPINTDTETSTEASSVKFSWNIIDIKNIENNKKYRK